MVGANFTDALYGRSLSRRQLAKTVPQYNKGVVYEVILNSSKNVDSESGV